MKPSIRQLGYGLAEIGVQANMKVWREERRKVWSGTVSTQPLTHQVQPLGPPSYKCTAARYLVSAPWRWFVLPDGSWVQLAVNPS